jgi:hypothetical protein
VISTLDLPAAVGLLDLNYCCKSVATQVTHDANWHRFWHLPKKFTGRRTNITSNSISSKHYAFNRVTMGLNFTMLNFLTYENKFAAAYKSLDSFRLLSISNYYFICLYIHIYVYV